MGRASDCERDASGWPELLLFAADRGRRDELVLALLASVGAWLGVLLGAGALVLVGRWWPSQGVALLGRVLVAVPLPAILGGRAAVQLGEQHLRRCRCRAA